MQLKRTPITNISLEIFWNSSDQSFLSYLRRIYFCLHLFFVLFCLSLVLKTFKLWPSRLPYKSKLNSRKTFQSQVTVVRKCSIKNTLKNLTEFTVQHLCQIFFLVQLQTGNFFKKDTLTIANFFKSHFLQNTSGRL